MNIQWKIDLSQEEPDYMNVEVVVMTIVKAFRAIKYAQPYQIKIKDEGIGRRVCERLMAAGLPVRLTKRKD